MIFSSTTLNPSTDKLLIDTFLSKLSFPLFTLYLSILIHHTIHAITLNICTMTEICLESVVLFLHHLRC